MVDLRPLHGVRFDRRQSGPVGPLLAPPYDVAGQPLDGAEFSIRKIEAVDVGASQDQHAQAARRYRFWLQQGILRRDPAAALYVHRHRYGCDGPPVVRTGVLARVRLTDWEERVILPHERTLPGPRRERLERLRAVQANLSPLYLLYGDGDGQIREQLAALGGLDAWPVERDGMGGRHELMALTEPSRQDALIAAFRERTLFVADGHHRYEAALAYRDACRRDHGRDPEAPWEFVLALLAAVEDPGVQVRPTHRLLTGLERVAPEAILSLLRRWFVVRPAEHADMVAADLVARVILPGSGGSWDVAPLPGLPHLALLRRERGASWRSLGVSAIEGVLESLLGAGAVSRGATIAAEVDAGQAARLVREGSAQAAFLLPMPDVNRLLAVAEEGDLLPPKSTWFDPKAPAGLVINDLSR